MTKLSCKQKTAELVEALELTHMRAYEAPYKYQAGYEERQNFKEAKRVFFAYLNTLDKEEKERELDSIYPPAEKSVSEFLEKELFINIFRY